MSGRTRKNQRKKKQLNERRILIERYRNSKMIGFSKK